NTRRTRRPDRATHPGAHDRDAAQHHYRPPRTRPRRLRRPLNHINPLVDEAERVLAEANQRAREHCEPSEALLLGAKAQHRERSEPRGRRESQARLGIRPAPAALPEAGEVALEERLGERVGVLGRYLARRDRSDEAGCDLFTRRGKTEETQSIAITPDGRTTRFRRCESRCEQTGVSASTARSSGSRSPQSASSRSRVAVGYASLTRGSSH